MKRLHILLLAITLHTAVHAQGWPADYDGVMLQGFYWDSYGETSWTKLQAQADELSAYFKLIWVPQSGWCNSEYNQMGYAPVYYFKQKSAFGSEAQLRSMIAAFRERGTGIIADVVVNHRNNMGAEGSWTDYPAETYDGQTYQMTAADICRDDDSGKTYSWANAQGIQLSENNDTGEDWNGCRDLDHLSPNVQKCIKAYLRFLLDDIGYTGFRYDMVKGFYAYFIADYNCHAKPAFSVGEYWDSTEKIRQWVDFSKGYVSDTPTSAAFDFQFRFRMRDAINSRNWRNLGWDEKPLMADNDYKQYAVTFVENHDTESRTGGDQQDPIQRDTLAANAYLLAMPGTPCVFYTHWRDCKLPIKQMILARRLAGISNTSQCEEKRTDNNFYAKASFGKNGTLLCIVGNAPQGYNASTSDFCEILSGKGFRYLLSRSANTVWIDMPDGTYEPPLNVRLTAVSNLPEAKIVYTLDGSSPTPESSQIANGSSLSITSSCTLTAGILSGGKIHGVQSRKFDIFEPHDVTLYVHSDITWAAMTFYVWDSSDKQMNGNWPGKRVTKSNIINGDKWYYQTFRITSPEQYINLVVSNTTANRQTVDITGLRSDRYLRIIGTRDENKYIVEDQTADIKTSIIDTREKTTQTSNNTAYNLQGLPVSTAKRKGIVIKNGKKTLYK